VCRFKAWPGGKYTRQLEATSFFRCRAAAAPSHRSKRALQALDQCTAYMACTCLVLCPRRYMLVPWRALVVDALKDVPRVPLRSHVLKPNPRYTGGSLFAVCSCHGPQLVLRLLQWKRRSGSIPQWTSLRARRQRRFKRCAIRLHSLELMPCPCIVHALTPCLPSPVLGSLSR